MESKGEPTQDVGDAKDGRLKIPLRKSAQRFLKTKADLERVEGRDLSHDEAMAIILGFVEVSNRDKVADHVVKTLRELERFLEENNAPLEGHCVELFREQLSDVLRGRIPPRHLSEAILHVG